jgi:hypothetical protein
MPDLPREWRFRLVILGTVVVLSGRLALNTASHWHDFEEKTADFGEIVRLVPPAPKLLYLVQLSDRSYRAGTPYVHLPAWVQAERGGWLSFHFASSRANPVAYRVASPDVPPPVPARWEFNPGFFDVRRHGPWFDTFLVGSPQCPGKLFEADPSIELAQRRGNWWLYRRLR